jgi:hypothetical protein
MRPLPAVASVDAAGAAGAPRVHPGIAQRALRAAGSQGDVDGAFARAAVRLARRSRTGASPAHRWARGLVASWTGDRLTVWMSAGPS